MHELCSVLSVSYVIVFTDSLVSVLPSPGISSWIVSIALSGPSFTEVSLELVSPSGVLPELVSFLSSPFLLRLEMKAVYLSVLHGLPQNIGVNLNTTRN